MRITLPPHQSCILWTLFAKEPYFCRVFFAKEPYRNRGNSGVGGVAALLI